MSQVGYPDWQPNVQVSDNPVELLNVTDTANSTTHDIGDVRRFASYVIGVSYGSTPAPSATNYAQVGVVFSDQPSGVRTTWTDTIEVNKGVQTLFIVDAMHGSFMEVTVNMPGVAGQSVNLYLEGSNRPVDRLRAMQADGNSRVLVAQQISALGAGATTTIFVPTFYGPGDVRAESETQPGDVTIFAGSLTQYLHAYSLAANAQRLDELILPTRPLRIDVHNSGAAAGTYELTVWAREN